MYIQRFGLCLYSVLAILSIKFNFNHSVSQLVRDLVNFWGDGIHSEDRRKEGIERGGGGGGGGGISL